MKVSKIIAAATLAIAGISGLATAAGPASAATRPPVVYDNYPNIYPGHSWQGGSVRPPVIVLQGNGSHTLNGVLNGPIHWTSWTNKQAKGLGYIPTAASNRQSAWITLSYVKVHNGHRYFAHLAEWFSHADGVPRGHGLYQYFSWTGKSWTYTGWKLS
jgi:hypothetical protein